MKERELSDEEIEEAISKDLHGTPVQVHPEEPTGVPPVDWRQLAGEDARTAWAALREWIEWFTVRYNVPISVIPNCWWKHGALVEELSALHVMHQASYDPNDTGYGPIGWHERLAQSHTRLQRAGAGCTGRHNELKPRSWDASTDEAEWDAWIDQSHAN